MWSFVWKCAVLCMLAAVGPLKADDSATQKAANTFFAGTVSEFNTERITIGRMVRGRPESRTFQLTPDTKIEGALVVKARVTVRYITDDDGDTATLIVVRTVAAKSKQKKP